MKFELAQLPRFFLLLFYLKCTLKTSSYRKRLSWAHTPVMSWAVCLGQMVSSCVSDKEEGVVAIHLPIGPLIPRYGLERVSRYEPSIYQPFSR